MREEYGPGRRRWRAWKDEDPQFDGSDAVKALAGGAVPAAWEVDSPRVGRVRGLKR